ncbi:uncharacterized protein LOC123514757 [Portunus trituberculatus]|uniref:uncharacterized protein LOC123514757 n=1 Tax=Portunus trituberculatus TaxID=210409 RepID=UPI001E1CE35C|nr:uncharacterized protein LOC123514757 [Portunus trituberculatus]
MAARFRDSRWTKQPPPPANRSVAHIQACVGVKGSGERVYWSRPCLFLLDFIRESQIYCVFCLFDYFLFVTCLVYILRDRREQDNKESRSSASSALEWIEWNHIQFPAYLVTLLCHDI